MKKKFLGLNFDSIQVLSQAELGKVRGGYGTYAWMCLMGGSVNSVQLICDLTCRELVPGGGGSTRPAKCIRISA
jgi:hypothetical protein